MITDSQLTAFCDAVTEKVAAWLEDAATPERGFAPVTFQRGPKYARIVKTAYHQRSAFCFVDLATGAIYKAGGWKAPEPKRHVRGNIANGAADVSAYGANYMR